MATQAPAATGKQPFMKGSIIWEKKGPLPVWAWALIFLAGLLLFVLWRRNLAATAAATTTGDETILPGNQSPPPVFIVPQAATPAVQVPINVLPAPVTPATVPAAPPGGGAPPPAQAPASPAPVPSAPGKYVSVTKYPSTFGTISGIWSYFKSRGGTAPSWQAVWNHPLNATLRSKRGQPDRIQPNDKVFVPGAS